jgi:hypothetical protein
VLSADSPDARIDGVACREQMGEIGEEGHVSHAASSCSRASIQIHSNSMCTLINKEIKG